ncbi:hypothetical protein CMT52_09915 [Elizabethkingia anophelis]|nr:hypothetical protein [Elizabethkingia anophelis]
MKVKPQIKGMEKVLRKIASFGDEARRDIADVTQLSAEDIAADAVRNYPSDYKYADGEAEKTGSDLQNIGTEKITDTFYRVTVSGTMGAYAEFGTGAYIDIPPGWENIAWSYYVNGKGIMLPQPYLYPAWIRGKKKYMENLKDMLKRLEQKYGK